MDMKIKVLSYIKNMNINSLIPLGTYAAWEHPYMDVMIWFEGDLKKRWLRDFSKMPSEILRVATGQQVSEVREETQSSSLLTAHHTGYIQLLPIQLSPVQAIIGDK